MAFRIAETPLEMMQQYLPDLLLGPGASPGPSGANVVYKGEMKPWDTFVQEVIERHHSTDWNHLDNMGVEALEPEDVIYCGDSTSVRHRLQQRIGHVMSAFCANAKLNLIFGYDGDVCRTPDSVCLPPSITIMTRDGQQLRSFGQVKAPWLRDYDAIYAAYRKGGCLLRLLLGEPARCMIVGKLKYAFLSTYNATIFLKQEIVDGQWTLCYSRPISHAEQFVDEGPGGQFSQVTLRQCFWYLLHQIDNGHAAVNPLPIKSLVGK